MAGGCCTFGKGNLMHRDYGKNAFAFLRRSDRRAIRVSMRDGAWGPDDAERIGPDFVWTVLQGTDQDTLAVGPGHYPDTAAYSEVVGQEIVLPSRREVIVSVPGRPGLAPPPEPQRALITLTACLPKFSARQRLIIHGVLVARYPKAAGVPPAELRTEHQRS